MSGIFERFKVSKCNAFGTATEKRTNAGVSENDLPKVYTRFLKIFETEWDKFMSEYNFSDPSKLSVGNRLRPKLVFSGYLLNKDDDNLSNFSVSGLNSIMNHCIKIEAVHKMLIATDDWINSMAYSDSTSFHKKQKADSTVLQITDILSKGFSDIYSVLKKIPTKAEPLGLQMVHSLTSCASGEVSAENTFDLRKIKEISTLDTSMVIRNCLTIGYVEGNGENADIIDLLDDIGYCYGYILQALKDLGSFYNDRELMQYDRVLISKRTV